MRILLFVLYVFLSTAVLAQNNGKAIFPAKLSHKPQLITGVVMNKLPIVQPNSNPTPQIRICAPSRGAMMAKVLLVVNGKEAKREVLTFLDPSDILKLDVLKDEASVLKYGEKAKNGVIKIALKSEAEVISIKKLFKAFGISKKYLADSIYFDHVIVSDPKLAVFSKSLIKEVKYFPNTPANTLGHAYVEILKVKL